MIIITDELLDIIAAKHDMAQLVDILEITERDILDAFMDRLEENLDKFKEIIEEIGYV